MDLENPYLDDDELKNVYENDINDIIGDDDSLEFISVENEIESLSPDIIDIDLKEIIIDEENDSSYSQNNERNELSKKENKKKTRYDSIFKGKKHVLDEYYEELNSHYIETFSNICVDDEVRDDENSVRKNKLSEIIYEILSTKTNARLTGSRRKPSKIDFNIYYSKVIENIDLTIYSKTEVFCEIAQYFSDNYYSMLKLLNKKWYDEIIKELQEKYRKRISKENEIL